MTLQLAVIASSVAGAILFFFGGYLMARTAASQLPVATPLEQPPGQAASDSRAPPACVSKSPANNDVSASPELDALRDEIATYRNRIAEAERGRGRMDRLEEYLQQRLKEHNKLNDKYRQLHGKWRDKEREADDLRSDKSDLKRRLRQATKKIRLLKERADQFKALEAERNQLTTQLQALDRQVVELERYKEESARLTDLVTEVPHLRDTINRLKQENRELRSLGLVYHPPAATTHTTLPEHLGSPMQHLLEQFAENKGTRGTALADERGQLVAGTGKYAEGLAVTSALCDGFMTQLANILPFASLRQLIIADTNAVTVAVYPFRVGSDQLTLASLSVGLRPGSKAIDDFVDQASRLINEERSQGG